MNVMHLRSIGFIAIDDFYRYLPPTAAVHFSIDVCHVITNGETRSIVKY
ncbi:MAG: hypothetical protein PHU27_10130 [Salinivirgaceae bacterium]|nr:hypothetical protein [Salinivirgaceae bacterium]